MDRWVLLSPRVIVDMYSFYLVDSWGMLLAFVHLEWDARHPKGFKTSFTVNSSLDRRHHADENPVLYEPGDGCCWKWSHEVQADLELVIHLYLPSECWGTGMCHHP